MMRCGVLAPEQSLKLIRRIGLGRKRKECFKEGKDNSYLRGVFFMYALKYVSIPDTKINRV